MEATALIIGYLVVAIGLRKILAEIDEVEDL